MHAHFAYYWQLVLVLQVDTHATFIYHLKLMINHISGAETKIVEQPEVIGRGEETKEENKIEDTGNVNKGYAVTEKPWRMRE